MKLNPAMWWKAATIMPRVTNEEWYALDRISKWLISTRFAAVVMTLISVLIAGLLALKAGPISVPVWILMFLALSIAHASNNLINDLVDFRRGIDQSNYFRDRYGPQPLERGLRTEKQQLVHIIINVAVAACLGMVVVLYRGGLALPLAGAGLFFMIFYTWPLKYIGLGELSLLLVWGPFMIGGGYYILTGVWSWNIVLASLPYALGVTATLMGKHIDKFDLDKAAGVYTLPVLLGERASRVAVLGMIVLQYVIVAWLVVTGFFTPALVVVVFSLGKFFRFVLPMFRNPRPLERPPDYPEDAWPIWFVGSTFLYTRVFGGLFVVGLLIDTALKRFVF